MNEYGGNPTRVIAVDAKIDEFMHYLYLPVMMPEEPFMAVPERLECIQPIINAAIVFETTICDQDLSEMYVYVSVRRGWATPDNPLNRPGWHCDGFGTNDINYVWWDGAGTRFAIQDFDNITTDHEDSMGQFEAQIAPRNIVEFESKTLYRIDPYIVHATPAIEPPGQMRSFVKVSISPHRYNLLGNSHNYLFDYGWEMHDRSLVRNDPAYPEADFITEEE
jgi:hypothetical protein